MATVVRDAIDGGRGAQLEAAPAHDRGDASRRADSVRLREFVSAAANYPATPVPINSISELFSAMSSAAGPILFVHAFTGLLLFVMAVGTVVVAARYHKRRVTAWVSVGMLSLLLAVLGGYVWASSDFSNGGGILLMVNGALAAYSFLFIALYFTTQSG